MAFLLDLVSGERAAASRREAKLKQATERSLKQLQDQMDFSERKTAMLETQEKRLGEQMTELMRAGKKAEARRVHVRRRMLQMTIREEEDRTLRVMQAMRKMQSEQVDRQYTRTLGEHERQRQRLVGADDVDRTRDVLDDYMGREAERGELTDAMRDHTVESVQGDMERAGASATDMLFGAAAGADDEFEREFERIQAEQALAVVAAPAVHASARTAVSAPTVARSASPPPAEPAFELPGATASHDHRRRDPIDPYGM